ncbi:hypothetical protein M885DRAFT_563638 [Pelagophyceae sp. CCMP2097]|nr:hypothetical protein M885DRAFT_563638 [Pelagophyceae sp. CCMP2097]
MDAPSCAGSLCCGRVLKLVRGDPEGLQKSDTRSVLRSNPIVEFSLTGALAGGRGCFYGGKGVAQSFEEAVRWFRLAAAPGHPGALYNLATGTCHAHGYGVPRDEHEALRCVKRAAALGYARAAATGEQLEAELATRLGAH